MKHDPGSSRSGCCSNQLMPSCTVSGVRPAPVMAGSASSGLQPRISSPRCTSRSR